MSSSRLILIFLGFIFLIIVILTSNQIAAGLRKKFGNIIPSPKLISGATVTPSVSPKMTVTPTLSPSGNGIYNGSSKGGIKSTPSGQTPATGPEDFAYLILGGSAGIGFIFKRFSRLSHNS